METVRRLAREGTTIILVTHHIDEIIPETRHVVLLRKGRVAFAGTPAEALTAEHLSDLFGAPMIVERSGGYYHVRVES
jgi:iron complex transport system ATP-binding protein